MTYVRSFWAGGVLGLYVGSLGLWVARRPVTLQAANARLPLVAAFPVWQASED